MAREQQIRHQRDLHQDDADGFSSFAHEEAEDNRILKVSLWGAIGFHVGLLLINFPAYYSKPLADEEREKTVFLVQPIPFQERKPEPELIHQENVKLTPVPDPSPNGPEPVPMDKRDVELDIPDADTEFLAIPNAPPAPDPPTGPIFVDGDVQRPVKIHTPQPRYTEAARRLRIQGRVTMEAIIDRQGNVVNVKILQGLPMGLSEESVKAARQWKFKPATLHGKPVDVYFTLTVTFQLQ